MNALVTALLSNQEREFVDLLAALADVQALERERDPSTGATLLHVAADRGLATAVEAVLAIDSLAVPLAHATTLRHANLPLHFAARRSAPCAALLLCAAPDTLNTACSNGETALLYACNAACLPVVSLLLSDAWRSAVDWKRRTRTGRNYLMAAVSSTFVQQPVADLASAVECVRAICESVEPADLRALLTATEDTHRFTVMHVAVSVLAAQAVPVLLDAAQRVGLLTAEWLGARDGKGRTALEGVRALRTDLHERLKTAVEPQRALLQAKVVDAIAINVALEKCERAVEANLAKERHRQKLERQAKQLEIERQVAARSREKQLARQARREAKAAEKAAAVDAVPTATAPAAVQEAATSAAQEAAPTPPKPAQKQPAQNPVRQAARPLDVAQMSKEGWVVVGAKPPKPTTVEAVSAPAPVVAQSSPADAESASADPYDVCCALVQERFPVAAQLDVRPENVLGELSGLSMAQLEQVEKILDELHRDVSEQKMVLVQKLLALKKGFWG
jgi:hypothetical protein